MLLFELVSKICYNGVRMLEIMSNTFEKDKVYLKLLFKFPYDIEILQDQLNAIHPRRRIIHYEI